MISHNCSKPPLPHSPLVIAPTSTRKGKPSRKQSHYTLAAKIQIITIKKSCVLSIVLHLCLLLSLSLIFIFWKTPVQLTGQAKKPPIILSYLADQTTFSPPSVSHNSKTQFHQKSHFKKLIPSQMVQKIYHATRNDRAIPVKISKQPFKTKQSFTNTHLLAENSVLLQNIHIQDLLTHIHNRLSQELSSTTENIPQDDHCVVGIDLYPDGHIEKVQFFQPCATDAVNSFVKNLILKSAPFPEVKSWLRQTLHLEIPLHFVRQQS